MWSFISSLPGPIIFVLSITTFAVILTGINQIKVLREQKRLSKYSDKELEDTIRKWIDKPYYKIQRREINDRLFSYNVEPIEGEGLVEVARFPKDRSQLHIGVQITVPIEVTSFLSALPEPLRSNMIDDLGMELTRFGIRFDLLTQPFKVLNIEDIVNIDDGLNEFHFLEHVTFVFKALAMVRGYLTILLRSRGFKQNVQPNKPLGQV